MTLSQALDSIPDDELVYLGALNGFITIGTCAEVKTRLDDINHNNYVNLISRFQKYVRDLDLAKKTRYYEVGEKARAVLDKRIDALSRKTQKVAVQIQNDAYIPLADRNVIEIYKRRWYDAGTIIKIEGEEHGVYWFLHEIVE